MPNNYDTNNPFDTKEGHGHRVFGHDPLTFGLKTIPANTLIKVKYGNDPRKLIKIGDFLGVGTDGKVSMWDLIWKFYGNDTDKVSGIMNCIKHSIVHFSKDLLTPAGLPLPFVTVFNKYEYFENLDASALQYKDSLMKKCVQNSLTLKASDFVSFFVIESFLKIYCTKRDIHFKQEMKLLAMGTCLSLQMATIVLRKGLIVKKKGSKEYIAGGNANVLMMSTFAKLTLQEIIYLGKCRKAINREYDKRGGESE